MNHDWWIIWSWLFLLGGATAEATFKPSKYTDADVFIVSIHNQ